MNTKYFNPYTDFGFKKLFIEEGSEELLIDFLNQLLPAYHQIATLQFSHSEKMNRRVKESTTIYEIYCLTDRGDKFIIELQKAGINHFKGRSLFYSTFPTKDQARNEEWDFKSLPVYFIAILDFFHDRNSEVRKFKRDINLVDKNADLSYDNLHFKFLQMPLFDKRSTELETHIDKWVYFLKNLPKLEQIPKTLNEPIFLKAFETAAISELTPSQHKEYQKSLFDYWRAKNVKDTALNEGKIKAKIEVAKALKQLHVAANIINTATGLTLQKIESL
ncbi:MAG: Rpn family recombination-promoting nuclease/putative transposase [Methyloprofundus sp.]|nr:Rpn family recombination-promoting nuclease/putative transposase [Methyloprofundus sp.]